jgi:hypothetical protein
MHSSRPQREAKAMMDSRYDPEADAVYIAVGKGTFAQTLEAGPFIYDVDVEGGYPWHRDTVRQQGIGARRLEKSRPAQ